VKEDPPDDVVADARRHCQVFVHRLPGRQPAAIVANIIHALNRGVPVVVGVRWPNWRASRSGYLSKQEPLEGSGHAVTIVGYKTESGTLESTVFTLRNSWGIRWGNNGYGQATYEYLSRWLSDAIILEVRRGDL
jgi:C1A family cysteine protease